jgi:hypothetical protein
MASAKKSARSAPAKSKSKKPAPKAVAKKSAPNKALKKALKKAPSKAARPAPKKAAPSLGAQVAKALGVSEAQAHAMAIGELAARLGVGGGEAPKAVPAAAPAEVASRPDTGSSLPQRLFLALDGRGLDGMGLPVEVIDLPCVLGSGKSCTIWVNSPQIETRHAQVTRGDEGWILEDLGTAHGTYFEGNPLGRRILQHGDLFLLANYLRVRAELR